MDAPTVPLLVALSFAAALALAAGLRVRRSLLAALAADDRELDGLLAEFDVTRHAMRRTLTYVQRR